MERGIGFMRRELTEKLLTAAPLLYKHFKGNIYVITDIAIHSETKEPMVIYKNFDNPDLVWCRPLSMFMSKVDHEKYPEVKQIMRFEKIK